MSPHLKFNFVLLSTKKIFTIGYSKAFRFSNFAEEITIHKRLGCCRTQNWQLRQTWVSLSSNNKKAQAVSQCAVARAWCCFYYCWCRSQLPSALMMISWALIKATGLENGGEVTHLAIWLPCCRRVALMALRPSLDFAHCPNLTKEELTGVLSVFLRDLFTCSVECGINNRSVNYDDIYISAQAKPSV